MSKRAPAAILGITDAAVGRAAAVLRDGGLVAFPTETVYGLGADATSDRAAAGIYAAKTRPSFNPLIAHVDDFSAALAQGVFNGPARALAEAFWPGPLTLVVPFAKTGTVSPLARAGLASVALRVPAHPVALALIAAAGRPIAAPSANRSGRVSPTRAEHVRRDLGEAVDIILDGGPTRVGVESTIVACLEGTCRILRPGGLAREAIASVIGTDSLASELAPAGARPIAPGLLASHYAPRAALRLGAVEARPDEAVLDFGGRLSGRASRLYLDLSPSGDPREAAANLFAALHTLDRDDVGIIAVAPIPDSGLGEAINDRLARAAAPR